MDHVSDVPIHGVKHENHLDHAVPDPATDDAPFPALALAGAVGAQLPPHDGLNLLNPAPVLGRVLNVPIVPPKAIHATFIS